MNGIVIMAMITIPPAYIQNRMGMQQAPSKLNDQGHNPVGLVLRNSTGKMCEPHWIWMR